MPIDPEIIKGIESGEITSCSLKNFELTDVAIIAEILKNNRTLLHLGLGRNNLGDVGAKMIAEALKSNQSLMTLFLADNKIGNDGAKALAEALKTNQTLMRLVLANNEIGKEGFVALFDVLKNNRTLMELNLMWNIPMCQDSLDAMLEVLRVNKTLAKLNPSIIELPRFDVINDWYEAVKNNPNIIAAPRDFDEVKKVCLFNSNIVFMLFSAARNEPDKLTVENINEIKTRLSAFITVAKDHFKQDEDSVSGLLFDVQNKASSFGIDMPLPFFYERNRKEKGAVLANLFQPEKWIGRTKEMQEEWQKVPDHMKKTFDFVAAITETRQKILKSRVPVRPALKKSKP